MIFTSERLIYKTTSKSLGSPAAGALGLPGAGHVVQSGVLCVLAGDFLHEHLLELSLPPCPVGNHEEPGPLAMVLPQLPDGVLFCRVSVRDKMLALVLHDKDSPIRELRYKVRIESVARCWQVER